MKTIRKVLIFSTTIALLFCVLLILIFSINKPITINSRDYIYNLFKEKFSLNKLKIPENYSKNDKNNNGISDPLDLVNSARKEVLNKTPYKSEYYIGGYPPSTEGVCTDVIWRAFKGININLKDLVDKDIRENTSLYPRVQEKPDPNIDFRRVPNLNVFFKRYAINLTTEIHAYDKENLSKWQPGDIVVILEPYEHIGIISDKRTADGVPYFIHSTTPKASEVSHLNLWNIKLTAHYRWKY